MARIRSAFVPTADRYLLQVNCYEPFWSAEREHIVIINSGAGVPQTFYRAYAAWLADHGFCVLTYDYRGVGGSRGKSIKGLQASIEDWGSKDCATIIEYARKAYGDAKPGLVVGHFDGCAV